MTFENIGARKYKRTFSPASSGTSIVVADEVKKIQVLPLGKRHGATAYGFLMKEHLHAHRIKLLRAHVTSDVLVGAVRSMMEIVDSEPTPGGFAELDAVRTDDRVIQEIITGLRFASPIRFCQKLADRISELLEAYKEENDNRVLSPDSLRSLLGFLERASALKCPSLTITPSGHMYATWKQGREYLLSVQFLDSREVRFVVWRPNPLHIGHSDQLSGLTTPDNLLNAIAHLNVLEWAAE